MADEMAQAETTAEQTDVNDSEVESQAEAENTTEDSEGTRGDLRVPLKEERTRRQELETYWNNPDNILQRAIELGVVEQPQETWTPPQEEPTQTANPELIQRMVDDRFEYNRVISDHPELATNEVLRGAVLTLVQQGKSHKQAADTVLKQMDKIRQEAKEEGMKAAKGEITDKEKAQTVTSTSNVSSDRQETDQLILDSKSLNPRIQKQAMIELLKRQNKEKGII